MPHRVVVVGAGAAGLSAALALRERGLEPLVLESEDRAGGKLRTESCRGFLLEHAALGLLDRTGELAELCAKLGITTRPADEAASLRFVEREGTVHAVPRAPAQALRTRLLTAREKIGLAGEPFRPPAAEDASVAEFFAQRLGPAGRFLGDAIQTGIHAGDPDRLELRTAFPALAALARSGHGSLVRGALAGRRGKKPRARLASFRGGMQELVDALSRRTAPKLGTALRALRRAGTTYRLQVESRGEASELEAERVVLAVPAPRAADVLAELDPSLAARLRELTAAPISLVHLAVRPQDVDPLHRGFGVLRPGKAVLGALFPAALWPERAPQGQVLLSALVGGARHAGAAALGDADLLRLVRDELRLPLAAQLLRVVRWPQAIPQYERGHGARIAAIERLASAHPGLRLTGAWYRGAGVLDCLRDGRNVAEELLK
jgi:protoporphyrinogen/coproporphyrinogen III oxidase